MYEATEHTPEELVQAQIKWEKGTGSFRLGEVYCPGRACARMHNAVDMLRDALSDGGKPVTVAGWKSLLELPGAREYLADPQITAGWFGVSFGCKTHKGSDGDRLFVFCKSSG